ALPCALSAPLRPPALLLSSSARLAPLRDPHSFPTRRSSDLLPARPGGVGHGASGCRTVVKAARDPGSGAGQPTRGGAQLPLGGRSEEHTSELQSRENLGCRLLLETKKQQRHPAQRDPARRRL